VTNTAVAVFWINRSYVVLKMLREKKIVFTV